MTLEPTLNYAGYPWEPAKPISKPKRSRAASHGEGLRKGLRSCEVDLPIAMRETER